MREINTQDISRSITVTPILDVRDLVVREQKGVVRSVFDIGVRIFKLIRNIFKFIGDIFYLFVLMFKIIGNIFKIIGYIFYLFVLIINMVLAIEPHFVQITKLC